MIWKDDLISILIWVNFMSKSLNLSLRKGDLFAVVLVVLIGLITALCFIPNDKAAANATVQIYQDGELVKELPLQSDQVISVDGKYHNTITIQNGKVAITESDCPGSDCVHSGWSSSTGKVIVCLPNRVEIRIVDSEEVDFVVR